ncbi:MAG TPA: hypothetical protein VF268_00705 [Gammaproteobacteria bacterium]
MQPVEQIACHTNRYRKFVTLFIKIKRLKGVCIIIAGAGQQQTPNQETNLQPRIPVWCGSRLNGCRINANWNPGTKYLKMRMLEQNPAIIGLYVHGRIYERYRVLD